jgi:hypothetical protein
MTPPGSRLRELLFAAWVAVWLCGLPVRLHRHGLPALLARLTPRRTPLPLWYAPEPVRAVAIVRRLCRLRCFAGRWFPRLCLRQSLSLYYVLARLGLPVSLSIGVLKDDGTLQGHAWVTVDGVPVAEGRPPEEAFRPIFVWESQRAHTTVEPVAQA